MPFLKRTPLTFNICLASLFLWIESIEIIFAQSFMDFSERFMILIPFEFEIRDASIR